MSDTKHTPTPWQYDAMANVSTADAETFICKVNGKKDAIGAMYHGECIANAAHIVKCVNAHDELVAALENLLNSNDGFGRIRPQDEQAARAALAKVKP